jgi:hypothetical protein
MLIPQNPALSLLILGCVLVRQVLPQTVIFDQLHCVRGTEFDYWDLNENEQTH